MHCKNVTLAFFSINLCSSAPFGWKNFTLKVKISGSRHNLQFPVKQVVLKILVVFLMIKKQPLLLLKGYILLINGTLASCCFILPKHWFSSKSILSNYYKFSSLMWQYLPPRMQHTWDVSKMISLFLAFNPECQHLHKSFIITPDNPFTHDIVPQKCKCLAKTKYYK